ncbi:MAG: DNA polymerase III subunit beta [Bacteroidales bacterium]
MRFIVNSQVLLKNLQSIGGIVGGNATLPILNNYLFDLKDKQLTLVASDTETSMMVSLELTEANEDGSIAIPAKILLDTLKTFADLPLVFQIDTETFSIEISAGDGKYRLAGEDANAFPQHPDKGDEITSLSLSSQLLSQAISKTIYATGLDNFRPVMSGVYVELSTENLTFVATDAHKLVRYRRTDAHADAYANFILPKKTLIQLKNIFSSRKDEIDVKIEYNKINAFFSFENMHVVCRLIEGKYPNYEAVIPQDNPNKLYIDRVTLLNSLRRVSIFANQAIPQAKFKMQASELLISAQDIDYASEAKERLACNYEGEPMEMGFNAKYIIEMLSSIETEEICLEMSQPSRAGILMPVGNENKDENMLALVMPVMLN